MKRKRKGSGTRDSRIRPTAAPHASAKRRPLVLRIPLWLLSAAPLASLATYLTIFGYVVPRISVEPPGVVDPRQPYKCVFRVQNQGYWSLNDIFYTINIQDVALDDAGHGYLEVTEHEGDWLSYGPAGQVKSRPMLDPLQVDSPSLEFTSSTFEQLCRDGREVVLQIDYRPDYYPFKKTACFRFRLRRPDPQQALWVPIANRKDFDPHFNASGTNKGWVILAANSPIFESKDIVLKSQQMVLIGLPSGRRIP